MSSPIDAGFHCVLIGIVLMNAAFGYGVLGSSSLRLVVLALGFLCILYGALHRIWVSGPHRSGVYVASVAVSIFLLGLSIWRKHQIFTAQSVLFHLVAVGLLLAGIALGRTWYPRRDSVGGLVALVIGAATIPSLFAFGSHAERISAIRISRDLGDVELNSVGVAFVVGVLGVTFASLIAFGSRRLIKPLWVALLSASVVVLFSTGTRGAVLYLVASVLALLSAVVYRRWRTREGFGGVILGSALVGGALIVALAIGSRSLLGDRFLMLSTRMGELFSYVSGEGVVDASSYERTLTLAHYFDTWRSWLLLGQNGYVGYPHNQHVEWVVRFGLFGLILALGSLWLFGKVVVMLYQLRDRIDLELALMACLFVFSYLQSLSSLSLEFNRPMFMSAGFFIGMFGSVASGSRRAGLGDRRASERSSCTKRLDRPRISGAR